MDGNPRPEPAATLPAPERGAPAAAGHWMRESAAALDAAFGQGYAAANPAVLAAMIQACAIEAAVDEGRSTRDRILDTVGKLSRETNATLLKLKPKLFG
ncbi:MAG: hypothetical protein AAF192_06265 [Pseudomonadota bacterium]